MNILFCDDNFLMREIIKKIFSIRKDQLEVAVDGHDAFEKIQAKPNFFDVLVTDYVMPGLSGMELIEKLRALNLPLKMIMVTGYSDDVDRAALDRLQLNGFLKKPFTEDAFLDCVKNVGG